MRLYITAKFAVTTRSSKNSLSQCATVVTTRDRTLFLTAAPKWLAPDNSTPTTPENNSTPPTVTACVHPLSGNTNTVDENLDSHQPLLLALHCIDWGHGHWVAHDTGYKYGLTPCKPISTQNVAGSCEL